MLEVLPAEPELRSAGLAARLAEPESEPGDPEPWLGLRPATQKPRRKAVAIVLAAIRRPTLICSRAAAAQPPSWDSAM